MDDQQNRPQSFWRATAPALSYPALSEDITVDAAVVGGGLSGALTAYSLMKEGKSVAVIESRQFASGTSGGTTAKISAQHELIYHELKDAFGIDTAKQFYEANRDGLQFIRKVAEEEKIDCGFQETDAYIFVNEKQDRAPLTKEQAVYEEIGIPGGIKDKMPLGVSMISALEMKQQAQFNPVQFINGLFRRLEEMGCRLYQYTRAEEVEEQDGAFNVTTNTQFTVTADDVVMASLFPAIDPDDFYSNHLKPATSHLLAYPYDSEWHGFYLNADDPKKTVRGAMKDGRPYLFVGGETHPTGDGQSTKALYEKLKTYAQETFGVGEPEYAWSEHDLLTPDRLPYIGRMEKDKDGIYVMTGFNKWGLTLCGAGAKLVTDLITGRSNPYEQLFDPRRTWSGQDEQDETDGKDGM